MIRSVTLEYLKSFEVPYAVIKPIYIAVDLRSNTNHFIKEMTYPVISAICVGLVVMLLKKIVIEEKLMNGSVRKIIEIMYDNPDGPNLAGALS